MVTKTKTKSIQFTKPAKPVKSVKPKSGTKCKRVDSRTTVVYWKSTSPRKKWMTITPEGKKLYWGEPSMQDYTQHKDPERRKNYRSRHRGILLKDGSRAINKKWSPAWASYYVTW